MLPGAAYNVVGYIAVRHRRWVPVDNQLRAGVGVGFQGARYSWRCKTNHVMKPVYQLLTSKQKTNHFQHELAKQEH